jgi:cobalt-zinc-cadmium efflux system outer membrane protein
VVEARTDRVPSGRRALLALLLAAAASPLRAGDAAAEEPPAISEREFLDRFARGDPRLEVLEARVQGARAEVTAARALPNPSVAYDREETFSSGAGTPETFVRLALPIDISGRRSKRIDAAEAAVQAAREEAAAERFALTLDALSIYHDAAHAGLRVRALRGGRDGLARLVAIVDKRVRGGDASGYDLRRFELELAAYDDLIASAERELASARRRLGTLVGEPDALYDANDSLAIPTLPTSVGPLASRALASRNDYRATKLRGQQADHELAAARREWVPGLVLTGGLKTTDVGMGETALGYVAGIAVSLPLFDHGQAVRDRAAALKRQARAAARVLEQGVPASVRSAHDELQRRIAQARQFSDGQLGKLDSLARAAEVSYREGERPSVFELLDAYRTAREVRLRELDLRRETRSSELDLWRALGRRP